MMCNPNSFALTHRVTLFQACWLHFRVFSSPVCPPECLSSYRALKYFFFNQTPPVTLIFFQMIMIGIFVLVISTVVAESWLNFTEALKLLIMKHWRVFLTSVRCLLLPASQPRVPFWMLPYRVLKNTYLITLISRRSVLCSRNVWLTAVTEEVF